DPGETLRFLSDHVEELLLRALVQVDVVAAQRLRGPLDRGERSAQLVGRGRDELTLQLVERPLLGQAAERVDDAVAEGDAGDREPELAPVEFERDDLRLDAAGTGRRRDRDDRGDSLPAGERLRGKPPERALRRNPSDRVRGRVPVLDDPDVVDAEDPVVYVLQHLGVALAGTPL